MNKINLSKLYHYFFLFSFQIKTKTIEVKNMAGIMDLITSLQNKKEGRDVESKNVVREVSLVSETSAIRNVLRTVNDWYYTRYYDNIGLVVSVLPEKSSIRPEYPLFGIEKLSKINFGDIQVSYQQFIMAANFLAAMVKGAPEDVAKTIGEELFGDKYEEIDNRYRLMFQDSNIQERLAMVLLQNRTKDISKVRYFVKINPVNPKYIEMLVSKEYGKMLGLKNDLWSLSEKYIIVNRIPAAISEPPSVNNNTTMTNQNQTQTTTNQSIDSLDIIRQELKFLDGE